MIGRTFLGPRGVESMVAVLDAAVVSQKESTPCGRCRGTGIVKHWNEFASFDDRRSCPECEAGKSLESRIAAIIARFERDEKGRRFSKAI
jgi:rubredoxin